MMKETSMINVSGRRCAPRLPECSAPQGITPQGNTTAGKAGRGKRTRALTLLAVAALGAGGFGFGGGSGTAQADIGVRCLWAGVAHPQGVAVAGGGWMFRCEQDLFGFPRWNHQGLAPGRSTVYNPGANGNPVGQFSPGAQQPGTDYLDYCVGSQLIEGREDVYEAIPDGRGGLYWRSAGPVALWTFDLSANRPGPSWRSASLCVDGQLT